MFSISMNGLLMLNDIKFSNFDKLSAAQNKICSFTYYNVHPLSARPDFLNTSLCVSIWYTSSHLFKKKMVKLTEMTNWPLKLLLLIRNPLVSSVSGDAPDWARGLLSSSTTYAHCQTDKYILFVWSDLSDQTDKYIWASQMGTFSSLPELMQDPVILFDRTNLAALILQYLPKPRLLSDLLFLQIRPSFP